MNKIDLIGKRFGRLLVISESDKRTKSRGMCWVCKCDCGAIKTVASQHLIRGLVMSCGCYAKEKNREKNTTHGYYGTSTYKSWDKMIQRCTNPNCSGYEYYGGRGITVCEEWMSFDGFLKDMGERPQGTSIDRINPDKGYFKDNCRWATYKVQANNTRRNQHVTYNGETKTIAEWAKEKGLKYDVLYSRLNSYGWSVEKALEM